MHQKKCRVSGSVSGNLPEPEKPEISDTNPNPNLINPIFSEMKIFFLK